MCGTCGCGDEDGGGTRIAVPRADGVPEPAHPHTHPRPDPHPHPHAAPHHHDHGHDPDPDPDHDHPHGAPGNGTETLTLEQNVLAKNEALARRNRAWLTEEGITALNLMSSPGAGKTTLLERTIGDLAGLRPVTVVEGDQETMLDADRIKRAGAAVVQVNTGAGCHLDAEMLRDALTALSPAAGSLVLIENVGNLVCPALFDLGEHSKVVIISVTEGTDKPLKYSHMFAAADLVVINKIDLLPYVDFDVERCEEYARSVNPGVRVLTLSATTGVGLEHWYAWVTGQR